MLLSLHSELKIPLKFMIRLFSALLTLLFIFNLCFRAGQKTGAVQKKSFSQITEKLQKIDGFVPIYLNAEDRKNLSGNYAL
jgi:hypothetical protein